MLFRSLANDAQPRVVEVDRVVAAHFAAIARERATALNRDGEYQLAREELEKAKRAKGPVPLPPRVRKDGRAVYEGLSEASG